MMMNSTSRGGMTPTPRGGQGDGGVARGRDTKPYNSFSSDSRNNNNLMQQSYRSQNTASRYNNSYLDESNADSLAARNRYGSTPQERRQRFLEEQNNRRRNREQQDNQGGGRRNRSLSPVGRGNPTTAGTATANLKDDAMYASTHSSASSRNSRSLSPIRTKSTTLQRESSDLPDISPPTITRPPVADKNYGGGPSDSHHLRINRTRSYSPSAEPYHHYPNNHRGSITESASVSSPNNSPRRTNGFPFRQQQQQQQQQQRQSITESPSVSPPNNNNPHHPPPAIATTRNHNGRLLGGVSPPFSPTKPGSYLYVPQNVYRNNNSSVNQRHNSGLRDSNTSIHSSIRGSATSVVSDITDMVSVTHDGIPVWSDHVDDEASAGVPPTKHQIQNRITIEIQPGLSLPLRGAEETTKAMKINFIVTPNCMVCTCQIQCIADAEYVLCPVCKSVSPIEGNTGNGGGVGLGLEMQ